jgi:hypothetical protein
MLPTDGVQLLTMTKLLCGPLTFEKLELSSSLFTLYTKAFLGTMVLETKALEFVRIGGVRWIHVFVRHGRTRGEGRRRSTRAVRLVGTGRRSSRIIGGRRLSRRSRTDGRRWSNTRIGEIGRRTRRERDLDECLLATTATSTRPKRRRLSQGRNDSVVGLAASFAASEFVGQRTQEGRGLGLSRRLRDRRRRRGRILFRRRFRMAGTSGLDGRGGSGTSNGRIDIQGAGRVLADAVLAPRIGRLSKLEETLFVKIDTSLALINKRGVSDRMLD